MTKKPLQSRAGAFAGPGADRSFEKYQLKRIAPPGAKHPGLGYYIAMEAEARELMNRAIEKHARAVDKLKDAAQREAAKTTETGN